MAGSSTNWHVVQRATKINVILADGSHYDAQYVSGDDKNDLALLRIQPKKPLPAVEIAGESQTMLGETVVAIGDPFGFDHTVTKGSSARRIAVGRPRNRSLKTYCRPMRRSTPATRADHLLTRVDNSSASTWQSSPKPRVSVLQSPPGALRISWRHGSLPRNGHGSGSGYGLDARTAGSW